MPASHDAHLLLALSRGDESAARELYARVGPRLAAYARAMVREDALAEDVVQQAWVRAISRPAGELAEVRDAAAWLVRLTRTVALNQLRARSRAVAHKNGHLRIAREEHPRLAADHDELRGAIDRLSNDQRDLILLKHVADLTFDQIAEALGENRSTLASRYRGAIDALRERLNAPRPPQSPHSLHSPNSTRPASVAKDATHA